MKRALVVVAEWDHESRVWVATSEDVPGLATEASRLDTLIHKLQRMVPELLDANGCRNDEDAVPFQLQLNMVAHRAATS